MQMIEVTGQAPRDSHIVELCAAMLQRDYWRSGTVLHENREYSIACTGYSASSPRGPPCIQLARLLDTSSAYLLTVRERLAAAFILASSFVQLFGSPWLRTLAKDEIMFLQEDESTASLKQPLLWTDLAPFAQANPRLPERLVHVGAEALD